MIKVGLTGGIGAGKTTISKLFSNLGVPIFNSDLCAREAEKNEEIIKGFKEIAGNDIYINGEIDRSKMRSIVFTDKEKLSKLNNLVLPFVKKGFEEFIVKHPTAPYVILESAILFETGSNEGFDYIITVSADIDVRIKRVLLRDKVSIQDVKNKLNNQLSDEYKLSKSDYKIINNGDDLIDSSEYLINEVKEIHNSLLTKDFN